MSAAGQGGAASSALGRLLGRTAQIEPQEIQPVVTAFLLFFCVLGGYFAVRPVRETVGTDPGFRSGQRPVRGHLDRLARRGAAVRLGLHEIPAQRISARGSTASWRSSLAAVGLCSPRTSTTWSSPQFFYVWISVLNLFIVSVFWSFLLELFDAEQTQAAVRGHRGGRHHRARSSVRWSPT